MKDFDYYKTFNLCKAYANLGIRKQRIIEFLFSVDAFTGTYTEFTKQLIKNQDLQLSIKQNISNIRKDLKYLEENNIIHIGNAVKNKKLIFLLDDWMNSLVNLHC